MATEFRMPKLGLTMEEGTITAWLVEDGTEVDSGAAVLTIETDKVESDVEASDSGVLHITGEVGEVYGCGERIGWFLGPDEEPPEAGGPDGPGPGATGAGSRGVAPSSEGLSAPVAAVAGVAAPQAVVAGGTAGARLLASPNARRVAAQRGVDLRTVVGTGPGGRITSEDVPHGPPGASPAAPGPAARPATTPGPATAAARQTANRLGVDLALVAPAAPGNRIERADVERHVRQRLSGPGRAEVPDEAPLLQEPVERVPLRGMRGTIAERMHTSLSEMAQLTLTMDVVMDAVVAHRAATEAAARPGYTDYVVAAAAGALAAHPIVNSQVAQGAVNLLPEVNVGVAVALEGGLVVPVVRRADQLAFDELCAETARLAGAARSGRLALEDLEGGTFSVSALGMYGVDAFTPVINPPNTAILGVGRLRDGIRWADGSPEPTRLLTLSLTWDHRAFDGAPAAQFTAAVRDRLEGWAAPEPDAPGRGGRGRA